MEIKRREAGKGRADASLEQWMTAPPLPLYYKLTFGTPSRFFSVDYLYARVLTHWQKSSGHFSKWSKIISRFIKTTASAARSNNRKKKNRRSRLLFTYGVLGSTIVLRILA